MALKPPLTKLPIKTAASGFYRGFSMDVTITAKIIIGLLVIWAVAFPDQAASVLNGLNGFILTNFATWYVYVMAAFVIVCIVLAIWPSAGRLKLGLDTDEPEFGYFSWFSMMFGAGIGVGMLTWAVAEPIYHFGNNPDVMQGFATAKGEDNILNAYKWSYLHWGFSAWSSYAIAGLGLGYFAYRRGLPLTIRSSLSPLFGARLSGNVGHLVDIVAVVATILGVAQTLGFGVNQFVDGMARIGVGDWLMNAEGKPSSAGIVFAIVIIMGASTLSALSGVGKGIKWLSNINMVLSIFLLGFLILFGSTFFGFRALFVGMWEYVIALPGMIFTIYSGENPVDQDLAGWQGSWTVFYWAWWVAFAPFVGLFLARISKGRTIREFVLGAVIAPSIMCFIWFAWAGGTAIDLELSGQAAGKIFGATDGGKIFAMTDILLGEGVLSWLMAVVIVVLLMTYLVTSADSAVLIVNTINAAGDEGPKARPHIIFWGVALGAVVAALLLIGGIGAIQTAMVIGALPFSVVMVLMAVALIKAIYLDGKREAAGISTTAPAETTPAE
ncbi:BCCT family transporter [Sulfitobacter pseudonitzschiae]|uniref:BCCT family transporter n=1 Tax=Pseudosulfitobacter pseudonitzschiae TaxID=1402135 RepID=A0A9Q2NFH4_9RHOB|nr:BCCT family transporter [Pseudosulfitobacter pseudonitzschiae]MBM2290923.1 BCCT family transporter [Pseudosulfitobacter pseudonitzschiae]MBM2295841.1 BCCT family transporter [Pseudosulfitobacter pseudonitzschiae]MBM2300754.1 BCCT family transporter [Pseudosulfitobacter pseudonitzschiae]MBM2310538.1 BCCT family transporter [Pseudosulfitobacter pseudonitzschiae]MBM2315451.1 BCCT family transporter [Pseudosulfitobacter pseudonitzschiae]